MDDRYRPRVDAVYTWVDGADPAHRESLEKALREHSFSCHEASIASYRYRDSGELRFSLRSLEANAPWLNHIYIVTQGHVPDWLDAGHDDITLIKHEDIFPNGADLPTFNSHAIETCLHLIPGISEYFLYFNDDLFLGRPAEWSDFFDSNGEINLFDVIHLDTHLDPNNPADKAYLKTRQCVAEMYGCSLLEWLPAHVPRLFRTSLLAELERSFPEEFDATRAARFRGPQDFVIRIAQAALLDDRGHTRIQLESGTEHYQFTRIQAGVYRQFRDFQRILRHRPRMLCLNDELNDSAACRIVRALMNRCLNQMFPDPSRFEYQTAV